ncbi:hypothetical protein LY76DRAFT_166211 [Colletotrichum caudatum]|nr:hypothetical protein LY76DRAFT_166211 [Colletotrichum caudatum]
MLCCAALLAACRYLSVPEANTDLWQAHPATPPPSDLGQDAGVEDIDGRAELYGSVGRSVSRSVAGRAGCLSGVECCARFEKWRDDGYDARIGTRESMAYNQPHRQARHTGTQRGHGDGQRVLIVSAGHRQPAPHRTGPSPSSRVDLITRGGVFFFTCRLETGQGKGGRMGTSNTRPPPVQYGANIRTRATDGQSATKLRSTCRWVAGGRYTSTWANTCPCPVRDGRTDGWMDGWIPWLSTRRPPRYPRRAGNRWPEWLPLSQDLAGAHGDAHNVHRRAVACCSQLGTELQSSGSGALTAPS